MTARCRGCGGDITPDAVAQCCSFKCVVDALDQLDEEDIRVGSIARQFGQIQEALGEAKDRIRELEAAVTDAWPEYRDCVDYNSEIVNMTALFALVPEDP